MPPRNTSIIGAPCWIELMTATPARARTFYGELFGWTSSEPNAEFGNYINFSQGDELVAGCMTNQSPMPDAWSVYLHVADAQDASDKALANGGTIILPPHAVGDLGTMVFVSDPGGAVIGGWQPGTHAGTANIGEPGTPVWFEVYTRHFDATVAFYQNVFGWETHAMLGAPAPYVTLGTGATAAAGIFDVSTVFPEFIPSHWGTFVAVENADDSITKAVALGGTLLDPATNTPFGRMATLADPSGATFKINGPA